MLALLRIVPVWAWAVSAALGFAWWQRHIVQALQAEQAQRTAAVARLREQAMHDALVETTRRLTAQQEVAHASEDLARQQRADADLARAALDRLRRRAAGAGTCAGAGHPAAAAVGPAASAGGDLHADVLGRLGEAARQLAAVADERGRAGSECAGRYDALKP